MRKVIFLFVSLLLSVVSLSQPTAVGLIAGMEDQSCLAAADSQGEIFVAGTTTSTVTVNSTLYYVSGWDDLFAARISSSGSILWYKHFGSNNPFWEDFFETPTSIQVDEASQSIYVAGCNYLGFQLDTFNIPPKSIFLVKIRYDGITEWVKWASSVYQGAGAARIFPGDLHLQNPTSIQWFFSSRDVITFENQSFAPAAYLMELQANGSLMSMVPVMQGVDAHRFSVTEKERLFVSQSWNDTIYLGDTMLVTNSAINANYSKFDTAHTLVWTKVVGEIGLAIPKNAILDTDGSSYCSGRFQNSILVGADTFQTLYATIPDLFLCKFDSLGELKWFKRSEANGSYGAGILDLTPVRSGVLYAIGYFSGSARFGTSQNTAETTVDAYIAMYDTAGNCRSLLHFGEATGRSIGWSDNQHLIIGGLFTGDIILGADTISSFNAWDAMVVSIDTVLTGIELPVNRTAKSLVVYANPNGGHCRIAFPKGLDRSTEWKLFVYADEGRLLYEQAVDPGMPHQSINISPSPSGIYSVMLSNGKETFTGRIVLVKE